MGEIKRVIRRLINVLLIVFSLLRLMMNLILYYASLKIKFWWYKKRYRSRFRKTLLKNKLPDKLVNDLTDVYVEFLNYIEEKSTQLSHSI